jgi:FKBP-type peptidyl-prolyl cis-trans isomerase FklB
MFQQFVLFAAIAISTVTAGPNAEGVAFLKANAEKDGVISLASGVQYKVLKKGKGTFHPTVNSPCETHYEGKLISGKVFDSSYARGSPTTFAPNQVIKGWTEIMQLMVEGDQWEVYIPSDKAYGDGGSGADIKGGDTLIFKMEIITIKGDKVPAFSCDPKTMEGCNDKEKKFIEKKSTKTKDEIATEIKRLNKMTSKKMTPGLMDWLHRRVFILGRLSDEL